jgi:hypothetical protein
MDVATGITDVGVTIEVGACSGITTLTIEEGFLHPERKRTAGTNIRLRKAVCFIYLLQLRTRYSLQNNGQYQAVIVLISKLDKRHPQQAPPPVGRE